MDVGEDIKYHYQKLFLPFLIGNDILLMNLSFIALNDYLGIYLLYSLISLIAYHLLLYLVALALWFKFMYIISLMIQ